jgi:hypothetical protein
LGPVLIFYLKNKKIQDVTLVSSIKKLALLIAECGILNLKPRSAEGIERSGKIEVLLFFSELINRAKMSIAGPGGYQS